jgi:hypothetical protein
MMPGVIAQKLRTQFCPYLITARHLNRHHSYLFYIAYSYLGEIFVLLAGFGLANPVMAFLSGGQSTRQVSGSNATTVVDFLSSSVLGWVSLCLLVLWGLAKYYVRREGLEKVCTLVVSYQRQCSQIERAIREALSEANPMPKLIEQQRRLSDLVDRTIAEGAVPGNGIDESLKGESEDYCQQLVAEFFSHWANEATAPTTRREGAWMELPVIKAAFVLDKDGKPKGRSSGEYEIELHIDNIPTGTFKVTYQLDGRTYNDPLREVRGGPESRFSEEITSYGDFVVQAKLRTKDHSISSARRLSEALAETHRVSEEPAIQAALREIANN